MIVEIAATLPAGDCRRLATAVERGLDTLRNLERTAAGALLRHAASQVRIAWASSDEVSGTEIAGLLRGACAGIAHQRAEQQIEVVWTGPDSGLNASRSTEAVVSELVESATSSLLLVSYNVSPYPRLDAALRAAARRQVEIILLFEHPAENKYFTSARPEPFPGLDALRWTWPAERRPAGAALHAKLIVVDRQVAFVSSANLSGRAATDNLECGLLVHNAKIAHGIWRHVTDLAHLGRFVPVRQP